MWLVEAEQGLDPLVLGADQGERARFLDQLADVLGPLLGFAARDEFAQLADDVAGAQRLLGGLGQRIADLRRIGMIDGLEQPAAALQIIGDRRERLVDLMRQRRGHLAHGGQPRQAGELGLQLLELVLGLLPLGQIADEAGEEAAGRRTCISPTASFMGKVEPSLRWPVTTRSMPMMRFSPVVR